MTSEDDFDDDVDEDGYRAPWCREICGHHQISWCRLCDDKQCPACVDDPRCPDCGCSILEEYHDWDCGYAEDVHD
jgi:hypothetical protein